MPEQIEVIDNPDATRFELLVDGAVAGHVRYIEEDGRTVVVHTEVDPAYAGRGYGSSIVRGMLDLVRDTGRPLVVDCPFIYRWIERNPDYAEVPVEIRPPSPRG